MNQIKPSGNSLLIRRRDLLFAVLPLLLFAVFYFPVITGTVSQWYDDPNYSHGFVIPFMSIYFIWEMRHKFDGMRPAPSYLGAALMAAGVLLYFAASIAVELFTMRVSMLIVLAGLVILNLGTEIFKTLLFPYMFLFLMIPLPAIVLNLIALPMQLAAARSAAFSLAICGIPVFRDGNIIHLAGTSLEVAEACSGIRSLVSLIATGIIFSYFAQKNNTRRTVLVMSTIPIAIAANAVRVSGTGILAHFAGVEAAEGFYHTFAGFLVFAIALLCLFFENIIFYNLIPNLIKKYE